VNLTMKAGKFYSIRMVYNQDEADKSHLKISWSWEGREAHVIPAEAIWHSPEQSDRMEKEWRQVYD